MIEVPPISMLQLVANWKRSLYKLSDWFAVWFSDSFHAGHPLACTIRCFGILGAKLEVNVLFLMLVQGT